MKFSSFGDFPHSFLAFFFDNFEFSVGFFLNPEIPSVNCSDFIPNKAFFGECYQRNQCLEWDINLFKRKRKKDSNENLFVVCFPFFFSKFISLSYQRQMVRA
jgi:hypothetical protein